ncbi:MAG TPA: hypothetical protein DCS28_03995 [Candidatus Moranbacteria bacterium]|nr:hypothetical protein [Candidatus Moranbacteria bacterium]HAT75171.1 hypothetical protein [Candidatus Moranbacteria bacterium]
MLFDLTKEIKLNEKNYSRYKKLQVFFYIFCAGAAIYIAYLILFPTQEFNFSFSMLTSNKGNAVNPRDETGALIKDGKFSAGQKIFFDATLVGNFSKIKINFTPDKQSQKPENDRVDLRKSYRAFLYPEGTPIGFKNGTLIKNNDDFYLVSADKLRKFHNKTILASLGFSEDIFVNVVNDELNYNERGDEISDIKNYPADSLFKIDGNYYLLNTKNILEKFVSTGAFHSQYAENLAIAKNADFLKNYTIAENPIGFADGSLISYGTSAFIASKNKIYPIGDPEIFVNQGYVWNDIIAISGDEFSLYEKEKLFTLTSIHPDGTVFFTPDSGKWYQLENKQKHLLPSEKISQSWLKKKPIAVLAKSLEIIGSCDLRKEFWGNYSCEIPLDDIKNTAGKYYEFNFTAKNDLRADNLNLLYEKNMTMQNLKLSLRNMILKIKTRYGIRTAVE